MIRRSTLVVVAVAALAACADLTAIQVNVCGNGVVEQYEDCDHNRLDCINCAWQCDEASCAEFPGFQCGVDGQCHAPGGLFEPSTNPVAFPVIGFRITDIDRDGYGDVVGLNATALSVRYGEPTGTLPETYNVVTPTVTGLPAVTHLVDPQVADVILPTADGLVVYSSAFGVPSPRQFPLGGDEGPENVGNRQDPFDAVQVDKTIGLFAPQGPDLDPASQADDPTLVFGLITLAQTGPMFDVETTQLCGEQPTSRSRLPQNRVTRYASTSGATFVAFTNDNLTCVIKVSRAASPIPRSTDPDSGCPYHFDGEPPCAYEVASVGSFTNVAKRPVLADLDGDGCPSLLVHDAGVTSILEYPGKVGGAAGCMFETVPLTLRINEPPGSQLLDSMRLAPAIDGHAPDALISSFGIHAVPMPPVTTWETTPLYVSDRELHRAVAGDIDSDGATDVVFSAALPNLDIARRVPDQAAFLLVRTSTSGAIAQTMIADYDGDQRDDLAYVEQLGGAQRLSIAYGTPSGLTAGIAADAFKRVTFMSPMEVRDSTDPFSLVDDLIVIDMISMTQPEITILHGSPSRTMLSFFGLPVPVLGGAFRAVVAGDFMDVTPLDPDDDRPDDPRSTGRIDVLAFQTFRDGSTCVTPGCNTAIWIVPGLPNARFGDAQWVVEDGQSAKLPGTDLVGDCAGLDSDPAFCVAAAKLVAWPAVKSDDPAQSHDIVLGIEYRSVAGTPTAPSLLRYDPAMRWDSSATLEEGKFPAKGRILELRVFDVDGDGMEELIAPFGNSEAGNDGHTKICRMNRDGTLAGACLDLATEILGEDESLECVDAVVGNVVPLCRPAGLADQLVALCRRPVADPVAQITRWQSYIVPILGFTGSLADAVHTPPGRLDQIQIGDVTGDGVDDIVAIDIVTGTSVLHVFKQRTTREHDACYGDD